MSQTLNSPDSGAGASTVGDAADYDRRDHDRNRNDVAWRDNVLGGRGGRVATVSWGSIFAGVVTFLALAVLFSLLTTAFGLDGSGVGAAIVSIVGLLLAFFSAGAVAGILSVRAGLIHGFLTWAASLLATLLLIVALTVGAVGAVGGVLGTLVNGLGAAAGPSLSQVDPSDVPTPGAEATEAAEDAAATAEETAQQAAEATQAGASYGFIGLLLGAIVSAIGGLLGSRAVNNRRAREERATTRV